ncbi:putative activity regulator of membrane protease YbbK [Candidatus Burkholderia verschuerenii]|uniref:Putative activity regulator of membrane protease YbbK n=1 Tax=Candidatus Burkholderia verschuerenii TaxID=242163 RepID=A0A0L0MG55_9BURK|nr:NfeD family protein [Candidatus Burkholderia verschuerenii]KND61657.1 putative activity regulator of membrane protease YbbK [Candidatus Burkholderia verschuerenii]
METGGLMWWVAAGALIFAELFTGTFYLLMIALGMIAGGIAYVIGAMPHVQMGAAALIALIAVAVLWRSRFGNWKRRDASHDAAVNLDIGATLEVDQWRDRRARAMYRGAQWDVELAPGETEGARIYRITALEGNRLIVAAKR